MQISREDNCILVDTNDIVIFNVVINCMLTSDHQVKDTHTVTIIGRDGIENRKIQTCVMLDYAMLNRIANTLNIRLVSLDFDRNSVFKRIYNPGQTYPPNPTFKFYTRVDRVIVENHIKLEVDRLFN